MAGIPEINSDPVHDFGDFAFNVCCVDSTGTLIKSFLLGMVVHIMVLCLYFEKSLVHSFPGSAGFFANPCRVQFSFRIPGKWFWVVLLSLVSFFYFFLSWIFDSWIQGGSNEGFFK